MNVSSHIYLDFSLHYFTGDKRFTLFIFENSEPRTSPSNTSVKNYPDTYKKLHIALHSVGAAINCQSTHPNMKNHIGPWWGSGARNEARGPSPPKKYS